MSAPSCFSIDGAMRVAVVGAKGTFGRVLLEGLGAHPLVDQVVSLVESESDLLPRTARLEIDEHVIDNPSKKFTSFFRYADAVVYAGWIAGGARGACSAGVDAWQLTALSSTCEGTAAAEVRAFVYFSSAATYAPAPPDQLVDEAWPIRAPADPGPLRSMVQGEHLVEQFERQHPIIRVVRLRTPLIVRSPEDGDQIGSSWCWRLVSGLTANKYARIIPDLEPMTVQLLHVADLQRACSLALTKSVSGPFNLGAEALGTDSIGGVLDARPVRLPLRWAFKALALSWRLGFHADVAGRVAGALLAPQMATGRAQRELGWAPDHSSRSIVEQWKATLIDRKNGPNDSVLASAPDPAVVAEEYRQRFDEALGYVGQQVRAITGDQWSSTSGYAGWSVLELVTVMAREVYRAALLVEGRTEDRAAAEVPGDPLGFVPADGWELATERGRLATGLPAAQGVHRSAAPDDQLLTQVLPDAICLLTFLGAALAKAVGGEEPPALLHRFVQRFEAHAGNRAK